jgi:hypothetical protein
LEEKEGEEASTRVYVHLVASCRNVRVNGSNDNVDVEDEDSEHGK